jgi:hypothetical protein
VRPGVRSRAIAVAATPALSPRVAAWWLGAGALVGAWLALRAWTPDPDPAHALCALRRVAHVGCATCGLTRALAALARGRLGEAVALHPMAPIVAAEIALVWGWWGLSLVRLVRSPGQAWIPRAIAANAVAFLLVWVVRLLAGKIPV